MLVTEKTIEENLLATIAAKKDLALAALDPESDVEQVDLVSGMQELKSRLEVLLGARPEGSRDETVEAQPTEETATQIESAHRERVAAAGGELLGAAFKFLGELVSQSAAPAPPPELVTSLQDGLLACVEESPTGPPRLSLTLPSRDALNDLAQTLARLLVAGGQAPIATSSAQSPELQLSPLPARERGRG